MTISQIREAVQQSARNAGFELAGIAPVHDFGEFDRFREWIEAGRAGEMKYMETPRRVGISPAHVLALDSPLGA